MSVAVIRVVTSRVGYGFARHPASVPTPYVLHLDVANYRLVKTLTNLEWARVPLYTRDLSDTAKDRLWSPASGLLIFAYVWREDRGRRGGGSEAGLGPRAEARRGASSGPICALLTVISTPVRRVARLGLRCSTTCARSSTDRAFDYGSKGWGFESLRARQQNSRSEHQSPLSTADTPTALE